MPRNTKEKLLALAKEADSRAFDLLESVNDAVDHLVKRAESKTPTQGDKVVRSDYGPEFSTLFDIQAIVTSALVSVHKAMREHEARLRSMATAENRSRKAGERRQVAADMRRSGMTYVEIGKHIGVSAKRARDLAAGARD